MIDLAAVWPIRTTRPMSVPRPDLVDARPSWAPERARGAPDPRFDRHARLAATLLDAPIALVIQLGSDRPRLLAHAGWDDTHPLDLGPLAQRSLRERGPWTAAAASDPAVFAVLPPDALCLAAHPIAAGADILGTLIVVSPLPAPLDPARLTDLAELAANTLLAEQPGDAERRLQVVENRFRLLWQTTLDVVVMLDEQGRIQFVNPAVQRVFGHTPESLVGEHLAVLQPERLRVAHQRGFQRYLDTGERRIDWRATEALGLHADGREFPIEISFSDMDVAGQRVFAGCIRDISARKEGEAAQRALGEQLRQAQKMEAIGVLAGGIAHDFNNVVAGILGNAALALDAAPPPALEAHLRQIQLGGRRGRELVHQILSFARRRPTLLAVSDLDGLVEEGLALLGSTWPDTVRLEVRLSGHTCHVHADAAQLSQVVLNLCTNALHAVQHQPGEIEVGTEAVELAGAAALQRRLPDGPYARLWVRDSGHGMDADTAARIFEPFFTTKPAGEGTGLGLAVVHGIVGAHGGCIGVSSEVGRGTTFEIHLPRCEPAPETTRPSDGDSFTDRGQGQRVLYVDDDDVMRVMMAQLLERLGYEAQVCDGAPAAIALLGRNPHAVDLVVTDFDMPGQSGLELAGHLLALRPDLPVVIISGNVTEALTRDALNLGVRTLMQKARTVEELGRVLARLIA